MVAIRCETYKTITTTEARGLRHYIDVLRYLRTEARKELTSRGAPADKRMQISRYVDRGYGNSTSFRSFTFRIDYEF